MKTKELTKIAMFAGMYEVVFLTFSNILYLELITFTLCICSLMLPKKTAIYSALCFGILHMLLQGVTPWTLIYALIYPSYAYMIQMGKTFLKKHEIVFCLVVGLFSFCTGQLLDLPYLLVSKQVTMFYLLMGLKTSLIQSGISCIAAMILSTPVKRVLIELERKRI